MAREMKDSGIEWIGEIPKKWNINSLSQLCSQVKNKNTDLQETNLLSLSYGKIKRKNIETTDGLLPESFDGYNIIEANDIVLRLTDLQNDHKSLRVGLVTERGIITSAYLTIRNHSESSAKFLYYYLHAFDISKGFYGMGAGVRQGLNWDGIKWLKILSPTVQEQQSIANFLDTQCANIDSVIEKTRVAIEEYKKLKQAVITRDVTKGIRPNREMKDSGTGYIEQIPVEWEVVKLRYLGICQNGISKGGEYFGSGFPFVSYSDVYKNIELPLQVEKLVESTEEEQDRYSVLEGDIFFTRTSETIEEIGFTSVCKQTIEKATFAGFLIRVRPVTQKLLIGFSKYYFRSEIHRQYFVKEMNLVTRASLGQELLKKLPVLVPSITEQSEIVAYLDEKTAAIDSLIQKKEQLITELEAYKKSLIYEYVTGKKEVPVHAH